ncbi:MAG: hypothetical protein A3F84_24555 [Candidatus Handelsmanbacteria bacterium RIFCSPLOWO2_12_FULL_64_10]|uniref:Uncharacterized protein n=1 Tax=Handelsmanbacteria sp. (strain RIFCSPLOWO2_12_FULL_64_10) TaxID=1817868 RepID=A0A1F6CVX5_HANXR|nr:MAG: hypothetical protein A3F84_24555 [Candidatus Handelsmanbacteria bacterium RIFCSPLOWO2_12_FULL_64_10]
MNWSPLGYMASVLGSHPLAAEVHRSVAAALRCPFLHLGPAADVEEVFHRSLDAAVRDIEAHPRGKLFRRLIEHGPHLPDDPAAPASDGETTLSDLECGACVEFVFSHMVNRFKGELTELLALEPCLGLVEGMLRDGRLPPGTRLYWADTVQERRRVRAPEEKQTTWGGFTKGADGLLAEHLPRRKDRSPALLEVHGVVEVKSMTRPAKRVLAQIDRHLGRLRGGVRLDGTVHPPEAVRVGRPVRIVVVPATWKLSREWENVPTEAGRTLVVPQPEGPMCPTRVEEAAPGLWRVVLGWSQEAIEQAAYEMTFWYMSQVGRHVYAGRPLPKGWERMTPEEAGRNAVKMMLYYMPLRPLSPRQERLAVKLYNVYSFGYPLGVDSPVMLWPEDFPAG